MVDFLTMVELVGDFYCLAIVLVTRKEVFMLICLMLKEAAIKQHLPRRHLGKNKFAASVPVIEAQKKRQSVDGSCCSLGDVQRLILGSVLSLLMGLGNCHTGVGAIFQISWLLAGVGAIFQISWLLADIDAPVEDLRGLLAGIDAPVIQELEPYSSHFHFAAEWERAKLAILW
ncbi:hypothetical protein DPMN_131589 [Dreissena polymorpha]|uniref:Uncharacterized protein n=1 Tax=Dreissena polymorpha TaxID=45954 RepID=A0A9D4J839_DREPO|nr:hypothetical protein DPMN_131589 [Dreissena polymorpha]